MTPLTETALNIAISQIGRKENPLGSNWGHPVQDYLASVGINFPASWCMAFVYWCFRQANESVGAGGAFPAATGGVLHQWELAAPISKVNEAQPGDIFIMDLGKGLGHTGIVESIASDGTLHTIEGNTNDSGSREGIEVCRKTRRPQKPIIGYLRY